MFWQETGILTGQHGDSENESLQTDIQRFIAIIGFCLMAVFALVQAIPVTEPEKMTVIEDVQHYAVVQEKELGRLKSENRRLEKDLKRLMQYEGIARSRQKELDQAKKDLARQREEVDRLIGEKIAQQDDLMHYKELLSKRDKAIKALKAAREDVRMIMEKAFVKPEGLSEPKRVTAVSYTHLTLPTTPYV